MYLPKPNTFDGSPGNPVRVLRQKVVVVRLRLAYNPADAQQGLQRAASPSSPAMVALPTCANETAWLSDSDFMGSDAGETVGVATKEACCALCQARAGCVAVTWNGPNGPCVPPPRTHTHTTAPPYMTRCSAAALLALRPPTRDQPYTMAQKNRHAQTHTRTHTESALAVRPHLVCCMHAFALTD